LPPDADAIVRGDVRIDLGAGMALFASAVIQ